MAVGSTASDHPSLIGWPHIFGKQDKVDVHEETENVDNLEASEIERIAVIQVTGYHDAYPTLGLVTLAP
jgi:hypothetical protein